MTDHEKGVALYHRIPDTGAVVEMCWLAHDLGLDPETVTLDELAAIAHTVPRPPMFGHIRVSPPANWQALYDGYISVWYARATLGSK